MKAAAPAVAATAVAATAVPATAATRGRQSIHKKFTGLEVGAEHNPKP